MNAQSFPNLEPIKPNDDWIAPLLLVSLAVSTLGWIVYGVFALAFDDINAIPAEVQSVLVIIGSALIVAGAEMNTAPTVVAVFRKLGAGKAQNLDKWALVASLVGSIVSALIAFSIRQTRLGEIWWRALALSWGPLVAGIAIAADYYAAAAELGLMRSDYDREIRQWLTERAEWNETHGYVEPLPPVVVSDGARVATMPDFGRVPNRLNGERATLDAERLERELAVDGLRLPSASTVQRWLVKAHSEGEVN